MTGKVGGPSWGSESGCRCNLGASGWIVFFSSLSRMRHLEFSLEGAYQHPTWTVMCRLVHLVDAIIHTIERDM